jgi:hypothetical protein
MDFQNTFTSLLHRNLEIEKLSIKGKLVNILFTTDNNGFSIEFNLISEGKNRIVKLPAPFKIEEYPEEGLLYLDYRLKTIFHEPRWKSVIDEVHKIYQQKENPCKFYDSILEITYS